VNLDPHIKKLADILITICVRELIARRENDKAREGKADIPGEESSNRSRGRL